jgi:hypothetical protein
MDFTPDPVKEEKDWDPLSDVQSLEQDFCSEGTAAGQESVLQSLTQVFSDDEQRSEIELSTQVFVKEEAAETKFPAQLIIKEGAHTKCLHDKSSPFKTFYTQRLLNKTSP